MKKMSRFVLISLLCLGLGGFAYAQHGHHHAHHVHHAHHEHDAKHKESATAVNLSQCWGRFRADGASAVYVEMHNTDSHQAAYVTGVKSAGFEEAMLHESYEQDGMKGMRHVAEVEIPAGQVFSFKPGAHHVMLFKPQSVKEGDKVAVSFVLSNGQELTTECLMKAIASRSFKD